jgi:hypothetical protein
MTATATRPFKNRCFCRGFRSAAFASFSKWSATLSCALRDDPEILRCPLGGSVSAGMAGQPATGARRTPGRLHAQHRAAATPRQDNLSQLPSYPDAKMMEITQSGHDFAQRESQL